MDVFSSFAVLTSPHSVSLFCPSLPVPLYHHFATTPSCPPPPSLPNLSPVPSYHGWRDEYKWRLHCCSTASAWEDMESETQCPGGCGLGDHYVTCRGLLTSFPPSLSLSLSLSSSPPPPPPQTQESKWVGYQGTLDYMGSDFTASLTVANPDMLDGSVVGVGQYLQAMTPR